VVRGSGERRGGKRGEMSRGGKRGEERGKSRKDERREGWRRRIAEDVRRRDVR
jgi:hypothetical protein